MDKQDKINKIKNFMLESKISIDLVDKYIEVISQSDDGYFLNEIATYWADRLLEIKK